MFDRADYALADFLLFSARVYYRMLELHNAAWWPLHGVAFGLGVCLLAIAIRPAARRVRLGFGLLAGIWVFVGWAFFMERYAAINWAAVYVAPVFFLQSIVLAVLALRPQSPVTWSEDGKLSWSAKLAAVALLVAIIGYPLIALFAERSWMSAEVFALTPDPTVIATLSFLVFARGWLAIVAAIIPVLWVAITALTLVAMGSREAAIAPLLAGVCIAALITRRAQAK